MQLTEVMNENLMILNLESKNKYDTIREMIDLLDKENLLNSKEDYLKDVLKREKVSSTNLVEGLSMPHAKSKGVKNSAVVFARSTDGISWDGEEKNVNVVFLIAVPEEKASDDHLIILSTLAKCFMHDNFFDNLIEAETRPGIIKVIENQINSLS
jgi:fructose-specific phosphotransferase system IIA component